MRARRSAARGWRLALVPRPPPPSSGRRRRRRRARPRSTQVGYRRAREGQRLRLEPAGRRAARKAAAAADRRQVSTWPTASATTNVEPVLQRLAQQRRRASSSPRPAATTPSRPTVAQQINVPIVVYDSPKATVKNGLVADIETASQEGAYLAGVLAAKMTKTGTLGIVISAADTNWYKQAGGFVAGARSVNPDVKFTFAQIGQAGVRRRRRRQARHAERHRRRRRHRLRHGRRLVVRHAPGRRDGEAAGRRDEGLVHRRHRRQDARSTRRASCSRPCCGTSRQVFKQAIADINAGTFGTHGYDLDAQERRSRCSRRTRRRPPPGRRSPPPQTGSPTGRSRCRLDGRPSRRSTKLHEPVAAQRRALRRGGLVGSPRRVANATPSSPTTPTAGTDAPAVELIEHHQGLPRRRRQRPTSASPCAAARCTACSARTAPASRR